MKTTMKTKVLDMLTNKFGSSKTFPRSEILKCVFKLRGETYDPKKNSGVWSTHLSPTRRSIFYGTRCGYMMKPTKSDLRHLEKISHNSYRLVPSRIEKVDLM